MSKSKTFKLPKRKLDSHKGTYGKALIVAGSSGMLGAAVLASRGCLRCGAGLVYLAVPTELVNYANTMTPEVIVIPLEKISAINPDAIAIGPGLGNKTVQIPANQLVVDADALFNMPPNPTIITPHQGEMARLMGKTVDEVQSNRLETAKAAAKKYNCIAVLKGNKTVVADQVGNTYINSTGNPGMATGGTGDVLTGMITAFLAQGINAWEAATFGVYLHGLAGDLAAKEKGEYSLIASDIIGQIPNVIRKYF
ncbi:MAG: NAD(P)H-hydrate dehydratase [bacterium]